MNDENDEPATAQLADGDVVAANVDALIEQSSFGTDAARSLRRRAEPAAAEKVLRLAQDLAVISTAQPEASHAPSAAPADEPRLQYPAPRPLKAWCNGRQLELPSTWQRALQTALSLSPVVTNNDVWEHLDAHVDGLNNTALDAILTEFGHAANNGESQSHSVVITGERGSGKTHLLRWVRERVQNDGGYFFLANLLYGKDFWQNIVHAMLMGLRMPSPTGRDQIKTAISRLAIKIHLQARIASQVMGVPSKSALDTFIAALQRAYPRVGIDCQDTARALILLTADDREAQDLGESYLLALDEAIPGERAAWGINGQAKSAYEVVGEISALLALTGPSVLAVDQIDTLIAQSYAASDDQAGRSLGARQQSLAQQVHTGLMELREVMRRTVTVVACLPRSWALIRENVALSVTDRFSNETRLEQMLSDELARALAVEHLRSRLRGVAGFTPPYPTWPVLQSAFADVAPLTPRRLLTLIDKHISACMNRGVLTELTALTQALPVAPLQPRELIASREQLATLDAQFADFVATAELGPALDPETEDLVMPELLRVALLSWLKEHAAENAPYSLDRVRGTQPAIHARLRLAVDVARDDEIHWAFRSVAATHHRAMAARLERLRVAAGLDPEVDKRKVFLLSTGHWAAEPTTQRMLAKFKTDGGVVIDVDRADLRVLKALKSMWDNQDDTVLAEWLRQRRPASKTVLLRTALEAPEPIPRIGLEQQVGHYPVPLGTNADTGTTVLVPMESLRAHVAIFAGSGSGSGAGKTVLIRRIIEECALRGVSSIVVDPNNEFAGLGDAWSNPPGGWEDGDAEKASDYLANTEVVICTPQYEVEQFDPAMLLAPCPGKRARVSIISLVGLPTDEQRQSFVNQLQMALFTWIEQHPAGDRPLAGVFVMDEAQMFVPSRATTACTASALTLASKARKYGLGLVFATQAPRGIHSPIVGNTGTQFYGFLNSPLQVAAAREMAQARASGVVEISRLTAGQFYVVGDGVPFQKVMMPMCLSALTADWVLERVHDRP